jgi:hypothetical protein
VSQRKKVLVGVGASLFVLIAYIYFFGNQTWFVLIARNAGRKIPQVWSVPQNLTDTVLSPSVGEQFSCAGYEFDIPWSDIDQSKTKTGANGCLVSFQSGIRILFTASPPRSFVKNVASKFGGEDILRRNYGDQAISSDYNFFQLMLHATPSSVRTFSSREAASRNFTLFLVKTIAMPNAHSGLFSFGTPNFKGLQYEAPGHSSRVVADLFDDEGAAEFIFFEVAGRQPQITQEEVNRVTQSLRRVSKPAGQSSPSPNIASVR